MNRVKPQNSKWAEIREHGLFGRHLVPVLKKPQNSKWVALVTMALVGITFYWMFTYTGPYRYLAELQIQWFGSYAPKITCLIVFCGLFLVTATIAAIQAFLLKGAEEPVPGMPTAAADTPVAANDTQEPQLPYLPLPYLWSRCIQYVFILLACFVILGMGAYSYYNGTHAGSLRQLSAADFQSGKLQSRLVYAEVRGHLNKPYLSKDNYLYLPMTSEENATGPVTLVVGINENEIRKYVHREADGTYRVRGIAEKGLEGDVKYAFEKNGTPMADTVWVVHAGRAPSDDKRAGLIMTGLGVALAGFVFAWQSYRKRKRAASPSVQATA
jgi:hypothetical protein